MPKLRLVLFLFFSLMLAMGFSVPAAQAFSIDGIRMGAHPGKTRMVLDMSGPSDFRVFVLADPYRMVIDLPDFEWRAQKAGGFRSVGVKAVRYGNLKPGISRIVFDMEHPVGIKTVFSLPGQAGKPDRLVVDFTRVSADVFTDELRKTHGNLQDGDYPATKTEPVRTASAAVPLAVPVPPRKNTLKPLVVIDPGHGGVDPGAIGANKVYEKHVVLALGKELKRQLEQSGEYRVLMTRESDVFIKLSDRVKFARKHEADLFISIHADSIEKHNVRGASVYTLSNKASDAQTAKLAARENRADLIAGIDLSMEDKDVADILVDLAMRDTMNQSRFFAGKLVSLMQSNNLRTLEKPHRYAGFAVLKAPDIPSVLVEAGFMSNKTEAGMLNSTGYRKSVAEALKKGIDAYFEQVRKNQRL